MNGQQRYDRPLAGALVQYRALPEGGAIIIDDDGEGDWVPDRLVLRLYGQLGVQLEQSHVSCCAIVWSAT